MTDLFGETPPQTTDNFNTATADSTKDEWLTPPEIIRALGEFDLDPCAPRVRPWDMAKQHYTIEDNGLFKPWHGRIWLNPPYGKETFRWLSRLKAHGGGGVALIFARTETHGFHDHIFSEAHSLFFFRGRISFYHVNGKRGGTAAAPSCLVSYSEADTVAIQTAAFDKKLSGRVVMLR